MYVLSSCPRVGLGEALVGCEMDANDMMQIRHSHGRIRKWKRMLNSGSLKGGLPGRRRERVLRRTNILLGIDR